MRVTVNDNGTWSYKEHAAPGVPDRQGLVDHIDRYTLRRIGDPTPNPLATVPNPRAVHERGRDGAKTWGLTDQRP
jgi:hypothetical protein